jgi:cobalamin biosynthesis Mg chelatase CobN
VNGSITIPSLMLGNIFITVQPTRGWDEVTDYHNPYLPPHHQYIAFDAAAGSSSSAGEEGETGKAYEVSASKSSGSAESQVPIYALLGVVTLVLHFRKNKHKFLF